MKNITVFSHLCPVVNSFQSVRLVGLCEWWKCYNNYYRIIVRTIKTATQNDKTIWKLEKGIFHLYANIVDTIEIWFLFFSFQNIERTESGLQMIIEKIHWKFQEIRSVKAGIFHVGTKYFEKQEKQFQMKKITKFSMICILFNVHNRVSEPNAFTWIDNNGKIMLRSNSMHIYICVHKIHFSFNFKYLYAVILFSSCVFYIAIQSHFCD